MNLHELTKIVADEAKAIEMVEKIVWPTGPICPHCGNSQRIYDLGATRLGLKKCGACRKQFSVRIGTIFEDSHIPLSKWLIAIHLMCASKKGVSAKQLERQLGISYKSAWFMCHRVRYAMTQEPLRGMLGAGPINKVVEIDETYIGGKASNNPHRNKTEAAGKKAIVMTLIERDGQVRTFPIPDTTKSTLHTIARMNIDETAHIMTDSASTYRHIGRHFGRHDSVDHSKEYVRGVIHTNFAESYHSLLKRGLFGTFHHVSKKHLPRYLREFEFRWNTRDFTDGERAEKAVREVKGKRLMYRRPTAPKPNAS